MAPQYSKYYEKIAEAIANDETRLKECVQAKVHDSCSLNDNWLNASIRYGTAGAWKLTPEYISVLVLDKEWDCHKFTTVHPAPYARVVLFKPDPPTKNFFSSAMATDQRNCILWHYSHMEQSPNISTMGIYAGLLPDGCTVTFVNASIKCLNPKEHSLNEPSDLESKPTTGHGEPEKQQVSAAAGSTFVPTGKKSASGDDAKSGTE